MKKAIFLINLYLISANLFAQEIMIYSSINGITTDSVLIGFRADATLGIDDENWSIEISEKINRLREIEPNENTKKNIERLLNGQELE